MLELEFGLAPREQVLVVPYTISWADTSISVQKATETERKRFELLRGVLQVSS